MAQWAITTANSSLTFETRGSSNNNNTIIIDSSHTLMLWTNQSSGNNVLAQVLAINTTTWAITTANSSLTFSTDGFQTYGAYKIDTNHFIGIYQSTPVNRPTAQVFTVNTTTWAVSTSSNAFGGNNWDVDGGFSAVQIDANHFLIKSCRYYTDVGLWSQIYTINTTTWAVTTSQNAFKFDTNIVAGSSVPVLIDANHVVNFSMGKAQVLTISTSTWAITTSSSVFSFDTTSQGYNASYKIDSTHILSFWRQTTNEGVAQVFAINTTTWAITTANSVFNFNTSASYYFSPEKIDTNHFMLNWSNGASPQGVSQIFTVNTSTWAITTTNSKFIFDTTKGYPTYELTSKLIDPNHVILGYQNTAGAMNALVLAIEPAPVAPTVTTQVATNITKNSFTGNGNITATGGANATRRGFCYKVGTTGDPTIADSIAYDDGDFGTGAFTKSVTSLTPKTGYRVAAYATNSSGTSYGATVQVTTLEDTNASFLMLFM